MPAKLAPSDMGWMWQHQPADIQIEMYAEPTRKLLNHLIDEDKAVVVLPLTLTHRAGAMRELSLNMDLSKLFLGQADAFVKGLERACDNSSKKLTESFLYCAHAYRALGLPLSKAKEPYTQTVFSID